jgi:hypothetical protein
LNDIACNLNSNTLKLNSNTLNGIQIWLHWNLFEIKFDWTKIRCKLVKKYWKFAHDNGIGIIFLKRHNFENTPFHFFLLVNWLNKF